MSKANEMTEQEKNEQSWEEDRKLSAVLDAKLFKAPVSYEWQLMVPEPLHDKIFGAFLSMLLGGLFIYMGISKNSSGTIIFGVIFGVILLAVTRYLFSPDKDTHYKLSPLGIIYTEKDAIPDVVYTIMRGFAWFSVLVCLAAVVFVGPLAFVGAGGMALLAFKFTGFHAATKTHTIHFVGDYKVKIVKNDGVLSLWSDTDKIFASGRFYFTPSEEDELIKQLSKNINITEIIQVRSMGKLDF